MDTSGGMIQPVLFLDDTVCLGSTCLHWLQRDWEVTPSDRDISVFAVGGPTPVFVIGVTSA